MLYDEDKPKQKEDILQAVLINTSARYFLSKIVSSEDEHVLKLLHTVYTNIRTGIN